MQAIRTKHFVIAGIAVAVLGITSVYQKYNNYWEEIEWYTQSLDYDFAAHVDSAVAFHENGNGFLYISWRKGELNSQKEDSLAYLLKHYKLLRFLRTERNVFTIFSGSADSFHAGDSIYVNSDQNKFLIFRNDRTIRNYDLRDYLSKRYF
jgi:hypothetical protein